MAKDWVATVLPDLLEARRPLECVAEPGELFYLPGGWAHLTLNHGETISIGGQVVTTEADQATIAAAGLAGDPEALYLAARGAMAAQSETLVAKLLQQAELADVWAAADTLAVLGARPMQLGVQLHLADFQLEHAELAGEMKVDEAGPELAKALETLKQLQEMAAMLDGRIQHGEPGQWRPSSLLVAYAWTRIGHAYCTRMHNGVGLELMKRGLAILPSGPTPDVNEQAGWHIEMMMAHCAMKGLGDAEAAAKHARGCVQRTKRKTKTTQKCQDMLAQLGHEL